jgi:signal transduction histidine kinase
MSTPIIGFILIIDDTPNNLAVMSETLTDAGFDIATALDGERALEQVKYSEPDLILLDIMMPGIDGFETCRRLKANPKTCNIPVIFMTALADADSKVKGFELGAVDYITKPFQEQEVLARVKVHLHLRNLSRRLEQQLRQSEKMSALGNLVAGVAHEINNPVGCIKGNLPPVDNYFKDLLKVIDSYQHYYPQPVAAVQAELEKADLEFLREDLPKLIDSMQASIQRIGDISTSLRTFSRGDSDRPIPCNIHEGINSTLLILKHRLKAYPHRSAIDVITEYGNLPPIECYAGQLNQVFMNLIANAIDAIESGEKNPPQITIKTELSPDRQSAMIIIKDSGIGMEDTVKQKIFDHLYTTKGVGKGTGLGLAIVHQIIVERHGGSIKVNSEPGQGTEFAIAIPIQLAVSGGDSKI